MKASERDGKRLIISMPVFLVIEQLRFKRLKRKKRNRIIKKGIVTRILIN